MVEWELTLECNYKCVYCTNLDKTKKPVLDRVAIDQFIQRIKNDHPGEEVFVFGGEPFLHPDVGYVIERLNYHSVPFVIQTNLSKKSVVVMDRIDAPFDVKVSIHPTEIALDKLKDIFARVNVNIRTVDVMYVGKQSIEYYFRVKDMVLENTQVLLTPVSDFGDNTSNLALIEFNQLRKKAPYDKLINFEREKRFGSYRSELWVNGAFVTKGKPCLYDGEYFLYGPNLEQYTCCYRERHDGICKHDKCFLM